MGKDKSLRSFNQDPFADISDDAVPAIKPDAEPQPVQPEPVATDGNGDKHPTLIEQVQAVVPQWLAESIAKVAPATARPKTARDPSRRRKKPTGTESASPVSEPVSQEQPIEQTTLPTVESAVPLVNNSQDAPVETQNVDASVASETDMTLDTLLNALIQDPDSAFPEPILPPESLLSDAVVELPTAVAEEAPNESDAFLEDLIDRIDSKMEASPALATATQGESSPMRAATETKQYIIFSLKDTDYATPLANVIEIERSPAVTSVPNMPEWVMGVTNLRGDIVSMIDLRTFLGVGQAGYTPNVRVLMAQTQTGDVTVGLYVDRVVGVRSFVTDQIKPPTASIEDRVAAYLQGIYEHEGRMIVVIDFNKLLLSPEIRQFEMA